MGESCGNELMLEAVLILHAMRTSNDGTSRMHRRNEVCSLHFITAQVCVGVLCMVWVN